MERMPLNGRLKESCSEKRAEEVLDMPSQTELLSHALRA